MQAYQIITVPELQNLAVSVGKMNIIKADDDTEDRAEVAICGNHKFGTLNNQGAGKIKIGKNCKKALLMMLI